MCAPTDYADQIVDLLRETDAKTASAALRIAEALIDYRAGVQASSALAEVREAFLTAEQQRHART